MKYAGPLEQTLRTGEVALQGPHGAHGHTVRLTDCLE